MSEKNPGGPRAGTRLASLDAFRGLAVAGMILVNNPGSWAYVYAPLRHAEWHGATPTDLVFPFFLFGIGVSMSFSFAARTARGDSRAALWRHVVQRSLIIYGLGIFLAAYPGFDLSTVRLTGVLARISWVYLAAGTLVLFLTRRALVIVAALCLSGYWAMLALLPVPGFGAGDLSPEGNLAAYLDRLLLGVHIWQGAGGVYDPEGLLSTIPAVSSVLAGLFAGDFLRTARNGRATLLLAAAGVLLIGAGLAWHQLFPINKPLWSSSYVLWSTGWSLAALAALYWLVDVRGFRAASLPLVVYGANALAVFVASGLLAVTLIVVRLPVPGSTSGETVSLYARIYEVAFASWAGPLNGSLAFAGATVLFWLAVAWVLYRRNILIKV